MIRYVIYAFLLIIFTAGCFNAPAKSSSKFIVFKAKDYAFADVGFLNRYSDYDVLEIYSAGSPVFKLEIDEKYICVDSSCVDKDRFNREYLSEYYDSDTLKNIVSKEPIFDGKNYSKTADGFSQSITNEFYDITYVVKDNLISFKDIKNGVVFKIKDIN